MTLNTKHFGELVVEKEKVVTFEEGILGFEDKKSYILLANDSNSPFYWLQSTDDETLAFAVVNPFVFFEDYSPEINDELIASLGELNEEHLNIYTILVVPENPENMTTNLKAPIVINNKTLKAKQVIVENEEYGIRHNIYEESNNMI